METVFESIWQTPQSQVIDHDSQGVSQVSCNKVFPLKQNLAFSRFNGWIFLNVSFCGIDGG